MTAKEELKQVYQLERRMKSLEESILEVETRLTRISPTLSDMPSGGSSNDKMTIGVANLIELKEELEKTVSNSSQRQTEILKKINRIENENHKTVLTERYINCRTFEEISIMFPYTYNHTCKLHGYALQDYQKLMSQDSK